MITAQNYSISLGLWVYGWDVTNRYVPDRDAISGFKNKRILTFSGVL